MLYEKNKFYISL